MEHHLHSESSIVGFLGYSQFFATINNAVMNTLVYRIPSERFHKVKLLSQRLLRVEGLSWMCSNSIINI